MSGRYFSSYDGKTIMADVDVNGNSLELTIEDEKVKAIGNIPVGGGDDSVWTSETSNALSDDNGDDILDENNEVIGDENAETLWVTRNGIEFKAKKAENATNDSEGNQITTTYAKKSEIPPSLPEPPADNVLLAGTATGNKVWQPLAKDTFSSLTEDDGDDIQDEEGNSIGDENSVELWTSFNGIGFGAERAVADEDGNNIIDTYATKDELAAKQDAIVDNETLPVNVTGNASTATHLSAYGTCDTWDSYDVMKEYAIIAESTFDIGSENNGDGSLLQFEYGNSDVVKLKLGVWSNTTQGVYAARVFVLESTKSLSWIQEYIAITYHTASDNTATIHIYVKFTNNWQIWRVRQLDCQTGDGGYTNWRPWTFYQIHGTNQVRPIGTPLTYIFTSPIVPTDRVDTTAGVGDKTTGVYVDSDGVVKALPTPRAYFNGETGYRRLVKIVPSLTAVGDRVIKFSAIQTWADAVPKTYEGVIDIRYGSTWTWHYSRDTKFSGNTGNIVLWYNNTTHEAYLVAKCEGSYSSFNLRIEECLDLKGVDKSEDITAFYTDNPRETSIPDGFSELTGT